MEAPNKERRGFKLNEFVTSCSTCMGKEGLLNDLAKTDESVEKDADQQKQVS
ncbi:MAG: hypothetical protein UT37_C0018G0005 [Parcubacteria group bacterium GW2011_GWA2_39_18]|nr:MAG: hypothetical protein UT37_C0018G0005 [Parcubacteria group bacterium GW2011_GWA2_39_18]